MHQHNFCLKCNGWIKGKNMSNPPLVKFRCKIKSVWPFLHRHCIGSRHNLPSSIILYDLLQCLVFYSFSYYCTYVAGFTIFVSGFKTTNCDECIDWKKRRAHRAHLSWFRPVSMFLQISGGPLSNYIACNHFEVSNKTGRPKQGWSWLPSKYLVQPFSLIAYHQQIVGDNNCNLMVLFYILLCKVT